jgi:DNA-binding transcriptional MerR regulator
MRLGVSAKALRLYEQRGLIHPVRTAAGWRTYGPAEMARARDIVALRTLGLSLAQVARVLDGEPAALAAALDAHQKALEANVRTMSSTLARVREMRNELAAGRAPNVATLTQLITAPPAAAFDLPWPWGGEHFELSALDPVTYLTGPLGSGKTKLALKLAEVLPGATFLGLERHAEAEAGGRGREALDWLVGEGATETEALTALLAGIDGAEEGAIVVDLVEQGLDAATQEALAAWLRRRSPALPPLIVLTRSSAILDLDAPAGETVIYCPANHAPPLVIRAWPGAPGLDLVTSCLAAPEVRARTEGTIAWRPTAA